MGKWTAADIPDQTGRTIVITGANSGLGLRSAEALAAKGARVLLACRNADQGGDGARVGEGEGHRPGARGAHARPPVARLGAGVRRGARRRARVARRPHEQRRDHGGPEGHHRGRLREPARHQPPRPLRAHRPAAADPAGGGRAARRHRVVQRPQLRAHGLRRPLLRASPLLPLARLRAVEAGQPPLHQRAPAPGRRAQDRAHRGGRPPRLRRDQPHRRARPSVRRS